MNRGFPLAVAALVLVLITAAQDLALLPMLSPSRLSDLIAKDASVFKDPATGALTITFRYAPGEPEVRIPVRKLGWPVDWREFKSIQFTFEITSLEALAIGFSDGKVTKDFMI